MPLPEIQNAEQLYATLLQALRNDGYGSAGKKVALVGILSGGAWLAERLHADLGLSEPIGTLDISFYRDDFSRVGLHPQVRPSRIPFSVEDAEILLVDDVLFTGRTVRAALNTLFDYGRPARIDLAVLLDRNSPDGRTRELPIEARYRGGSVLVESDTNLAFARAADGSFSISAGPARR